MMKVQIELIEGGQAPEYKTLGANGADLYARLDDVLDDDGDPILCIKPGETKSIPAGFKVEVPDGYAMLILPRSGLSAKTGLRVSNAPGLVDTDYRGEVAVLLTNIGEEDEYIAHQDRIAQACIVPIPQVEFIEVLDLSDTDRGEGKLGSTGK